MYTKNWTECSLAQHRFPIRFVRFFFFSSVFLLVRVTMADKNKAVVCCLLATSAIKFSVFQSSGNDLYASMNARFASLSYSFCKVECLEMMSLWCRQVNWGNCRISWENCAVLCVKDDWKGQFWGLRYCQSKLRSLLSFPSGMTLHSKIVQFNWECIAPFTCTEIWTQ
jgi:hypothetical protein